jgi:DNA-binding MarR family transcriptional regulator
MTTNNDSLAEQQEATLIDVQLRLEAEMTLKGIESRIAVNQALQLLDIFRDLDAEMPIGEAVSFLLIASGETRDGGGLTVTELSRQGGFALASASRYMKSLSLMNRQGHPGHEVVTNERDPQDERKKVLRISSKGQRVLKRIQQVLSLKGPLP